MDEATVLNSEPCFKLRDWEKAQSADNSWAITPNLPNFSRGLCEQICPEAGD